MSRPSTFASSLPSLGRILREFVPYLRQERALVAGSLFTLLVSVGLKLLEPWPLKWVFDGVLFNKHGAQPVVPDAWRVLAIAGVMLIVITALRAWVEYLATIGFALAGNRVLTQVRNHLFRHLLRLSLSFHTKARGGDLTVRVISDVNMLKDVAVSALLPLVANALILVGMAVLMTWLDWRLTLISLVALPLYAVSAVKITQKIRDASRKQRAREGEMAATAAESLAAIKDVQALCLEPTFAELFCKRSERSLTESVQSARWSARLERRVDVFAAIATALVLVFGARSVLRQEMTPGELLVFLAYLKRSFHPLQDFAKYSSRIAKAAAAGERVLGILNRVPDVADRPDAIPAPPFRGAICFSNVTFGYDSHRPVLRNIDLETTPGQRVAIIGASGIGKSTFLNLVMRLYDPTAGGVTIDGIDLRSFSVASLRAQISVVLQDSLLFAASVRDNIAYAASSALDDEIEAAARMAHADEFIRQLPQGYQTILGERGVTLSHGQRQRLAIARAALRRSSVLLLDEPTTGLDEESERAVIEALDQLSAGRTTILVTHDLRLAARADMIVVLEGAQVRERGTHLQLLAENGRYATLYRLQVNGNQAEAHHAFAC